MKNKLTFLGTVLCLFMQAQNGINYKALIKDDSGNVVANQSISIQFTILEDATSVYQETHAPTTDDNGVVIVNIGEGTPVSGDFSTIDWGSNQHHLNVQVDIGSGLVDMGTTAFKAVPYALNVNGLQYINEGSNSGWRLKNKISNNYGDIGSLAVDLSHSNSASSNHGATGLTAFASGFETEASGNYSTALGRSTSALGFYSTSLGINTLASGSGSLATGDETVASGLDATSMGYLSEASGDYSSAFNILTTSQSFASTVFGRYNIGGGDPVTWVDTDPIFEVGNGASSLFANNALTILKNGTITAPSLTNVLIETAGDKALITKEYADGIAASGLEAIDEGSGVGWRLISKDPNEYGPLGSNAVDLSENIGLSTTRGATGSRSFASGLGTTASAAQSTAMGGSTTATGNASMAINGGTTANGESSTAMGEFTVANGFGSLAVGVRSTADSYASLAIGRYNVGTGSTSSWISTNPLFEIGIGSANENRVNALTVLKNGNIGIGNTYTPTNKVEIRYNSTISSAQLELYEDQSDFARLNFTNPNRSALWAIAGFIGQASSADRLNFYNSTAGDIMSIHGTGDVYVNGGLVHSSDRRLKKEIEDIPYGLTEIMALSPKAYNWNHKKTEFKSLGLIAQDVQTIITNIVHTDSTKDDLLSVNYTELIPVLIKAIQEQQKIIESQNTKINNLTSELALLNSMEERIKQLEMTLKTKEK